MKSLTPPPKMQFFDSNGEYLSGGKVYTYESGTITPLATYTDYGGLTPNTNPVILDSRGQASVWLGQDPYTFAVYDSLDVLQPDGGDHIIAHDIAKNIFYDDSLVPITADNVQDAIDLVSANVFAPIEDIISLINISTPVDNQTHGVLSYFAELNKGGDDFYWNSTINKNTANGGTIIDPDNIGGFDGTTSTLAAFLTAQGSGVGTGCWIRQSDGIINAEEFGAVGGGVTDDAAAIQTVDSVGNFLISSGDYKISSNITIASNVTFLPGALLIPDNAITVTFTGAVMADQYTIFDFSSGGDFALSEAGYKYNISHFSGNSFNDKWDNLRTNLVEGRHYTLVVPIPKKNEVGAVDKGSGNWNWVVDGEIVLDTKENNAHWITYGQFYVTTAITNCFKFGLTTKTEDIDFPLPLWVNVDIGGSGSCTNAVVLHGISRFTMPLLTVNNCDNALSIDPANVVSFIDIDNIQAGNNCRALNIDVTASSATNMSFQTVQSEVHGSVTGTVVTLTGPMRNLLIDRVLYNKNTGTKITNAVVIENNSFGRMNFSNRINEVYANAATTAVRIQDTTSGAGSKTEGVEIGFIGTQGTDDSLNADYCIDVTLGDWLPGQTVTVGSTVDRIKLSPFRGRTSEITDAGGNAIINGHGTEAVGAPATPPNTANWETGEIVTNTNDDQLWFKWQDTGVSANDFKQIG